MVSFSISIKLRGSAFSHCLFSPSLFWIPGHNLSLYIFVCQDIYFYNLLSFSSSWYIFTPFEHGECSTHTIFLGKFFTLVVSRYLLLSLVLRGEFLSKGKFFLTSILSYQDQKTIFLQRLNVEISKILIFRTFAALFFLLETFIYFYNFFTFLRPLYIEISKFSLHSGSQFKTLCISFCLNGKLVYILH